MKLAELAELAVLRPGTRVVVDGKDAMLIGVQICRYSAIYYTVGYWAPNGWVEVNIPDCEVTSENPKDLKIGFKP